MSKRIGSRWGLRAACALVMAAGIAPGAAQAADPAPAKPPATTAAAKPAAKVAKAPTVTQESAQVAFETFAKDWMRKMNAGSLSVRESRKLDAKKANVALTFSQYAEEFTTELKRTSSTSAPFVGLLRYVEKEYSCADATEAQCQVASETNVTEIFRFERGQWIY